MLPPRCCPGALGCGRSLARSETFLQAGSVSCSPSQSRRLQQCGCTTQVCRSLQVQVQRVQVDDNMGGLVCPCLKAERSPLQSMDGL